MTTWLRMLKGNPLPWLLEEETPAVRHLALRQLLDQPEDAPEVQQARFSGMETTAHVSADGSCSWEEADTNGAPTLVTGYDYVYTYTVSSGKVYQMTDTGCSNADTPGASETMWYDPAHPTHFLTANAWTFDWIFFLGFSIPMLLLAFAFLRQLFRRLFAPSRRFTEVLRR